MRKKVITVLLSIATAIAAVGCGAASSSAKDVIGQSKDEASIAENVTDNIVGSKEGELTVAIWDEGQRPGLQQIIDEWSNELGIKATIQVVNWSDYWTLLEAGATGGELPDVFWMHSNVAQKYM